MRKKKKKSEEVKVLDRKSDPYHSDLSLFSYHSFKVVEDNYYDNYNQLRREKREESLISMY